MVQKSIEAWGPFVLGGLKGCSAGQQGRMLTPRVDVVLLASLLMVGCDREQQVFPPRVVAGTVLAYGVYRTPGKPDVYQAEVDSAAGIRGSYRGLDPVKRGQKVCIQLGTPYDKIVPCHGEPVGTVEIDGKFYCRDAEDRIWLSKGECD